MEGCEPKNYLRTFCCYCESNVATCFYIKSDGVPLKNKGRGQVRVKTVVMFTFSKCACVLFALLLLALLLCQEHSVQNGGSKVTKSGWWKEWSSIKREKGGLKTQRNTSWVEMNTLNWITGKRQNNLHNLEMNTCTLTFVVLTLFPVLQLHPVRSGKTLHSSPSIHGCIWHHHFWATMEAKGKQSGRFVFSHVRFLPCALVNFDIKLSWGRLQIFTRFQGNNCTFPTQ